MSRMLRALGLMGAGLSGFVQGTRDAEDDRYERKRRTWEEEDRAYRTEERDRARRMRDEIGAATQPQPDDKFMRLPDTADNRDAGTPGAEPAVDTRARDAANSPEARIGRAADVRMKYGDVEGAMSARRSMLDYNTAQRQGEVANLQLAAAKRSEIDREFNDDVLRKVPFLDWGSAAKFLSNTKADGANGELKVDFAPSADKKQVVMIVQDSEGNWKQTPNVYPNSPEGFGQMIGTVLLRTPPEQKLKHLQDQAKTEEEKRRWNAEFDVKKQEADARTKREERMASAEERRAKAEQDKHELELKRLTDEAKIPSAVRMQAESIREQAKAVGSAITKAQAEGIAWEPDKNPAQRELVKQQAVLAMQMRRLLAPYMPGGTTSADQLGVMGGEKAPAPTPAVPAKPAPPIVPQPPPAEDQPVDPMAGMSFAQRQAAVIAKRQAASTDPDLARMDAQRAALLRAGKAAEANAIIQDMTRLRQQRYGF